MSGLETGLGLDIVLGLQSMSSPALDVLAKILDAFGGFEFYLLLVIIFYWTVNLRLAKRVLLAILISGLVIVAVKLVLMRPRPFMASPEVIMLAEAEDYGVPSAHVGVALAVGGVLAAAIGRRWAWLTLGLYAVVMAWGRMYAGVHYPQDVIVGGLIGIATILAMRPRESAFVSRILSLAFPVRFALLTLLSVILAVLLRSDNTGVALAGTMVGMALGYHIEQNQVHFSPGGAIRQRVIRLIGGVLVVVPVVIAIKLMDYGSPLTIALYYLLFAFVSVLGAAVYPAVAARFGLAARMPDPSP